MSCGLLGPIEMRCPHTREPRVSVHGLTTYQGLWAFQSPHAFPPSQRVLLWPQWLPIAWSWERADELRLGLGVSTSKLRKLDKTCPNSLPDP